MLSRLRFIRAVIGISLGLTLGVILYEAGSFRTLHIGRVPTEIAVQPDLRAQVTGGYCCNQITRQCSPAP